MQTLLLGTEQVRAYLTDLKSRLTSLGTEGPTAWVPLGYSGTVLLKELFTIAPELSAGNPIVVNANCRRDGAGDLQIVWGENDAPSLPEERLSGKNIMVVDSAVHSGSTMAAAVGALWQAGAAGVCSYSLVLKESSSFVPSYWAVSIADEDRAFFLLDAIPNNRFVRPGLCAEGEETEDKFGNALVDPLPKRFPFFSVRRLSHNDLGKNKFAVGVPSLNRSTWADLYYSMRTSDGFWVYLLERKLEIVGYVAIALVDDRELSIEQVAVHPDSQGLGYAGALLRWAETLARLKDCNHLRLWGILEQRKKYLKMGFREIPDELLDLGDEKYVRMRKCLLPHTGCCPPRALITEPATGPV